MTSTMLASVVVPTYERPSKLERMLESVCDQTIEEYEIIVVDDGSKSPQQHDVLEHFAERERIEVLQQENSGPAAARNRGWRRASGEFILFTDDDCVVPPEWIETLVEEFEEGIAAVGGSLVPLDELLETNSFARAHRFRDQMSYDEPDEPVRGHDDLAVGGTANVAYRRDVLAEMDGFDESFPLAAGEDADLQRRVVEAGYDMKFVPIAVRHNDDYAWRSFVKRAIRSGEGTHHFHRKHGEPRSVPRILFGLVGSVAYFPLALRHSCELDLASLYVLERILCRYGELKSTLGSEF
ncbi:glycosyltransferase [Halogeometricum borinquense]|uniref:Glycosyltransferase n=1 Tax=Halogeometricum borinquense TaxID=60847 RepID=A0A6C0UI07_9EURY|nr:glycosyltransferase [Halogeometricum borinquense]QIB74233.1 glycosyltransferase [Halogeometricum borinquense]